MENLNYKEEIEKATSEVILENLRIKYLGRKGIINKLFEEIKTLPKEKRREKGQKINEIKKEIETLIDHKKNELKKTQKEEFFDSTLPGKPYPKGSLHPLTYVIEEIS
jgi:phenylalanyl-tRNA synthetase alpha chain